MLQQPLMPPTPIVPLGSELEVDGMVDMLVRSNMAKKLDQLLPLFKQLRHDHFERGKNSLKTALSTLGVTVSFSLGIFNLAGSCSKPDGTGPKCAQASASLGSAVLFLGLTFWNVWELYRHQDRYKDFLRECDAMFDRSQMRKLGRLVVDDVFGWINDLNAQQLRAFKKKLELCMAASTVGVHTGLANAGRPSTQSQQDLALQVDEERQFEQINDDYGDD